MFWFFVFLFVLLSFAFFMTKEPFKGSSKRPLTFPISYRNYGDTSFELEAPSHSFVLINILTGENEKQEIAYNQGHITEEQFKIKQRISKAIAEEKLGKDHPSVKVLESYIN